MVSAYRPLENTYDLFATIWGNLRSNTKDEAAKDWTASIAKAAKLIGHVAFISVNILVDAAAIRSLAAVCLNTGSSERYKKLFQMAVASRTFLCVASMAYVGYQLGKDKKFNLFSKISPEIQLKGEVNVLKERTYELCETIARRINDLEDDVEFGMASKESLKKERTRLQDLNYAEAAERGRLTSNLAELHQNQDPQTLEALKKQKMLEFTHQRKRRDEQLEKIERLLAKGESHFKQAAAEEPWNSEQENYLKEVEADIEALKKGIGQLYWPRDISESCADIFDRLEDSQEELLLHIKKLHSLFKMTNNLRLKADLKKIIALLHAFNKELALKIIAAPNGSLKENEKTELRVSIYSLVFWRQLCILVSTLSEYYVAAKTIASWNIIWPLSKAKIQATPLIWQLATMELIAVIFGASAIYLMSKKTQQVQYLGDKKITIFN